MRYDSSNVFAKILRKELSVEPVFEDDFIVAINDIKPQAPVHVLVIPKGCYSSPTHFMVAAPAEEIVGFWRGVYTVISLLGLDKKGVRLVANDGEDGGQEVSHFHLHLLGGRALGAVVCKHG